MPPLRPLLPAIVALALAGCGARDDAAVPAGAPGELRVSTAGWKTDFTTASVPLDEFVPGGPPRDGIPPIDDPKFEPASAAGQWLTDREPVLVVESGDEVRAYPVAILTWHEIVNDELGGRPVAVSFCPLCNSSVVFDREVEGQGVLRFGTTGNLRKSDLVMWDDKTESWWQQITGEAVVGELTGTELETLPSQTLAFGDFWARHPEADVLSRDTGFQRPYGRNPYQGYDAPDGSPFLYDGETDDRLPAMERVVAIREGEGAAVVVPFSRLARDPVANLEAGDAPVAVLFTPEVASALDADTIADSRDVGTAGTFDRRLGGRTLTFEPARRGRYRDEQTGSIWDVTGRAVAGELEGERLAPVVSDQQFWFALAAFLPEARIVR